MNEQHFAYKLRQHLNRGLHEIRPDTLDRLAAARQAALARQKQAVTHPVLAAAGNLFPFHSFRFNDLWFNQTLAAIALILCALYSTFWVTNQRAQELGNIDSAILSDELPIGAFTDKGFAAWLDSESSAE
jgi:predicted signal transduction protein with EAL and GGDEF domain